MTGAAQACRPFYKKIWFWVVVVLVMLLVSAAAFVVFVMVAVSSALDIDTTSQLNRWVTERALTKAFDGQLAGVDFTAYGEMKSVYNTDLSAVARIAADDMSGISLGPVHAYEVGKPARIAQQYPHLNLSPDAVVVGRAEAYAGSDRLIFLRLDDGTGILELQSF